MASFKHMGNSESSSVTKSLQAKHLVNGAFGCLWSSRRAYLGREEPVWVAVVCICSTGAEPEATLPALCVFVDRILLGGPKILNTPALDNQSTRIIDMGHYTQLVFSRIEF